VPRGPKGEKHSADVIGTPSEHLIVIQDKSVRGR
jgi:hypothetical protein